MHDLKTVLSKVPSPDLKYFPDTLPSPRPHQLEIAREVIEQFKKKKYVVLLAPTGAGKSAIAAIVHNMMVGADLTASSFVLTPYIVLQQQYLATIPESRLYMGRDNFVCNCADEPCTCAEGFLIATSKKPAYKSGDNCPYERHRDACMKSPQIVCNYMSYLYGNNAAGLFGRRRLMICDEGHTVEDNLLNYIAPRINTFNLSDIALTWKMLESMAREKEKKGWSSVQKIFLRLMVILKRAMSVRSDLQSSIESGVADRSDIRRVERINNIIMPLKFLSGAKEWNSWFYSYQRGDYISARPLVIKSEQKEILFGEVDKVMIMSATISAKYFADLLSISKAETSYIEYPSFFPPENRPIYIGFGRKLSASGLENNTGGDFDYVVNNIKKIMRKHKGKKGVIHTSSYRFQNLLMHALFDWGETGHKFVFVTSETRDESLERHKSSDKPTVLVSPSFREGIDLPDAEAEFQIICKVPFMRKSPFINHRLDHRRHKNDPYYWSDWYSYRALEQVVQAAGRGVRSPEDKCDTYILDAHIKWILEKNWSSLWKYVKAAIKHESGI